MKVLVMDNGHAIATGGRPIPPGLLERVLRGRPPYVSWIDRPWDEAAVRQVLSMAIRSDRMEIVVARFR
jgi:hypothetical protein